MADRSLSWTERTAFHDLADAVSRPRKDGELPEKKASPQVFQGTEQTEGLGNREKTKSLSPPPPTSPPGEAGTNRPVREQTRSLSAPPEAEEGSAPLSSAAPAQALPEVDATKAFVTAASTDGALPRRASIPITADYLDLPVPDGALDMQLDTILEWIDRQTNALEVFVVDDAGLCVRAIRQTEDSIDAAATLVRALRYISLILSETVTHASVELEGDRILQVHTTESEFGRFALCVLAKDLVPSTLMDVATAKLLEVTGG